MYNSRERALRRASVRVVGWVVGAWLLAAGATSGAPVAGPITGPITEPITGVDSVGRAVTLARPAQRIVSLAPSHTEWVFALGAGGRLVGRTTACDAPPAAARVPAVGSLFPPDYEAIVAARPDLVLMLAGSESIRARLEALGLTVFVLQPRSIDGVIAGAETLARLLAVDPAPAVAALRRGLAAVTPATSAPRVAFVAWTAPVTVAGPDTFAADLIRRAGGQVVPGLVSEEWPRISLEQLVVANPDALVIPAGLALGDAWAQLPAVAAGRVCRVDADLLSRPGPRVDQAVARVAACLGGR